MVRRSRRANCEPFLAALSVFDAQCLQDLFHACHERSWSAKKERLAIDPVQVLFDYGTAHVASRARPFCARFARNYHATKSRQPILEAGKIFPEDDIALAADGIEQRDVGLRSDLFDVSQHRYDRRNPARAREQDDTPVLLFVEIELPEGSVCLYHQALLRVTIQER
jgi:hypothetical protein